MKEAYDQRTPIDASSVDADVHYDGRRRYQFQSAPVRLFRWIRFRPAYSIAAGFCVLAWLATGSEIPTDLRGIFSTRREFAKHIWMTWMSRADFRMGHYWTTEEVLERLKSISEITEPTG